MALDDLVELVRPYTKTSRDRIYGMVDALAEIDAKEIAGDVVECGVWKAGNIILARKLSPNRVCWLYDTFAGMAPPQDVDTYRNGLRAIHKPESCVAPVGEVVKILWDNHVYDGRLTRFVIGDVSQTLLERDNLPDKIALLRLDTDWYASTLVELQILFPRLERGGILIVDDYGHWHGARKAVDEYFGADHPSCSSQTAREARSRRSAMRKRCRSSRSL